MNNLTYHGGPVIEGINTDYLIFWEPTGKVSANYNSLIERYFSDVGNTGLYQNNSQYTDSSGKSPASGMLGGAWVDTTPYPHSPVLDQDLQTQINSAINQFGWKATSSSEFFVFIQSGTDLCMDTTHSDCASNSFCAYHGWTGTQLIYAAMPYDPDYNCGNTLKLPNNDVADETINNASHEQMESTSDPYGTGWIDTIDSAEEADKCSCRITVLSQLVVRSHWDSINVERMDNGLVSVGGHIVVSNAAMRVPLMLSTRYPPGLCSYALRYAHFGR